MANKMLIDASHQEETRVVVVRGNRVEEFDFESATRKQLRGNIYLAKVTRVEPSLQAAFVEYGGNRHGFLAFSEIHPDYYQIPVADRQALIADEARAERDADRAEDENGRRGRPRRGRERALPAPRDEVVSDELVPVETIGPADGAKIDRDKADGESTGAESGITQVVRDADEEIVEQVGGGDAMEDIPDRAIRHSRRQYKIQEVIKRRQILLVQVVKEERGSKGAALTTYLSLAGRYSVLMPNTGRGGGISRKITNAVDRKRLKTVAQDLEVPEGMGVILRTAGASRTKAEIKRDFEYLLRLWENVRALTLESTAPALVYEEGSLVKRAIRDLYNKDIDEVLVAGDSAYRDAKDFMRMLMPSHAKNVQPYKESQPVFARFGVEAQLDAMFSNQVTLKSGGYIVINQTEALVAIDVNSGRATREHNIEDTALKTNQEAADEVARQLRLRDLAGLIVIDFIDMDEKRNNRAVERRLNEALKNDRARIQVGRISPFGLLEMSRQRIRTGVLEGSSVPCPHCAGAGIVRATASIALQVLRAVEDHLLKGASHHLVLRCRTEVALYILNQKRSHLRELEDRFGVNVTILADESHTGSHAFTIERGEAVEGSPRIVHATVRVDSVAMPEEAEEEVEPETGEDDADAVADRRRKPVAAYGTSRRGERPARPQRGGPALAGEPVSGGPAFDEPGAGDEQGNGENGRKRRRRRRRRGGRGEGRENGVLTPMPTDAPQPDVTGRPFGGELMMEPGEAVDDDAVSRLETPPARQDGSPDTGRRRRRGRGGRGWDRREGAPVSEQAIPGAVVVGAGAHEAVASGEVDGEVETKIDADLTLDADNAVIIENEPVEEAKGPAARLRKPRAPRRAKAAPADAAPPVAQSPHSGGAGETGAQARPNPGAAQEPARSVEPAGITAVAPPEAAPSAALSASAPGPAAELAPSRPVVIGAEPDQPKRGWWARAKATLSGQD
jgi:ribonuclease E